jgi:hypothetical protein
VCIGGMKCMSRRGKNDSSGEILEESHFKLRFVDSYSEGNV